MNEMIDLHDFSKIAYNNISHRKLRAYLTMIGIFIGMAAVVAFISLGQGLEDAVNEQFESIGYDKIMVMPSGGMMGMGTGGAELTDKDLDVIKRVKGVNLATGMLAEIGRIEYSDEVKYTFVIGMPTDSDSLEILTGTLNIDKGRMIKQGDDRMVVIGYLIAEGEFFDRKIGVGDRILLGNNSYRVVGTAKQIGNSGDDTQVYIPMDAARELFNEPEKLITLYVEVTKGYNIHTVVELMEKALRKLRDVEKGDEDFTVQTSEPFTLDSFTAVPDNGSTFDPSEGGDNEVLTINYALSVAADSVTVQIADSDDDTLKTFSATNCFEFIIFPD